MSTLKLIASSSWGVYNKEIAKKLGLEEAIILGELASEHDYWLKQNNLTVDGYFYSTVENIENQTTISEYRQRKAINTLKSLKLIDVQLKGLPAKRYIKINETEIEKLLVGVGANKDDTQLRTSSVKSKELAPEKLRTNNNKNKNNNKNNNKDKLAKANASSQVSSNINIDIDNKDNNNNTLDIENNLNSRNLKAVLIPYIEESFSNDEVKAALREWVIDVFANGKTLTLKQLMNQCDLLTSNCETKEELISLVNKTLESKWATFRYVIEAKNKSSKNNYQQQSKTIRVTEQKRTSRLGAEVF